MSDLLVRDLPDGFKRQLAERARKHGHSLSREALLLMQRALAADLAAPQEGKQLGLGTRLRALINPVDWSDDLIPPRDEDEDRPPPDFS